MVPLLSAAATAQYAALFAAACIQYNVVAYLTPLIQFLHHCSAALSADVLATAARTALATADGVAAEGSAGCAPPDGPLSADQLGAGSVQQPGQRHEEQPDLEWESDWAHPVATALPVRQVTWHAVDATAGSTCSAAPELNEDLKMVKTIRACMHELLDS